MVTVYFIATPIGNLNDMTGRAIQVLSDVDYILAEDTRVTAKLLKRFDIQTKQISWHQHSGEREWQRVKEMLADGKNLAVVTDAGTPGMSDPGGKLIERIVNELPEVAIVPLPGASALTTAISAAGIPLDEFLFLGFLPHKKGRQKKLKVIEASHYPVIIFESVYRFKKTLTELAAMHKRVVVCRELTKKFESIYRGSAEEVLKRIPDNEIKGEFVIIIEK